MGCTRFGKSLDKEVRYTFGSIYMTMFVIGSVGNGLALWFTMTFKKRNRRSNIGKVMCSLIVSDAIVSFLCLPLQAARMFDYKILMNCLVDSITYHLTIMTVWSSSLTICFITFDRYVLLTKYTKYDDIITDKRTTIFITISWIYAGIGPITKQYYFDLCSQLHAVNLVYPVVFLSIIYSFIVRSLRRNISPAKGLKDDGNQQLQVISFDYENSRRRKVARRATLLILTFVFCSATATTLMFTLALNKKLRFLNGYSLDLFTRFSFLGLTANSCMNPIIYVMRDSQFKKECKKMINKWITNRCKETVGVVPNYGSSV